MDTSYLVSCYDSTDATAEGQGLAPFSFRPPKGSITEYFPSGQPAFGLSYIPFFIDVSDDASVPAPRGETYAAAAEPSGFDGPFDAARRLIATFAFRDDASLLAARARNFDGADARMHQFFSGYSRGDAGDYDFHNGEFYWNESDSGRYVQDRRVVGFTRTSTAGDAFSTVVDDGPECGATLMTEHGNAARACMGDHSETVWWKRIER